MGTQLTKKPEETLVN